MNWQFDIVQMCNCSYFMHLSAFIAMMCCVIAVPPLCSTLSHPDGGMVTTPGDITLGTVATYHCNEGLMLLGNATRTCQSNGVWSGEEPMCISPPSKFCNFFYTKVP